MTEDYLTEWHDVTRQRVFTVFGYELWDGCWYAALVHYQPVRTLQRRARTARLLSAAASLLLVGMLALWLHHRHPPVYCVAVIEDPEPVYVCWSTPAGPAAQVLTEARRAAQDRGI